MNRALRDVHDPEAVQAALESQDIFVEAWDYDPTTRVMNVTSPADHFTFEIVAIRVGLHVAIGFTTHGTQRKAGVR